MVGKQRAAQSDKARMAEITKLGCVCCWIERGMYRPAECHHITEGGKRLGHQYTIPLCEWHHRGIKVSNIARSRMKMELGPSLADNKREFVQRYGTERELLEITDYNLAREAESR